MADVFRANRKASDADILRLNSVGLSLATIAKVLDCHPTTITLRLKGLKVEPADTRRSFMEDILLALPAETQEWLADQVNAQHPIKEFIGRLIEDAYAARKETPPALDWATKMQRLDLGDRPADTLTN